MSFAHQMTIDTRPAHIHRPDRPPGRCNCGASWAAAVAVKTGLRDEPAKRWRLTCECGVMRLVGGA